MLVIQTTADLIIATVTPVLPELREAIQNSPEREFATSKPYEQMKQEELVNQHKLLSAMSALTHARMAKLVREYTESSIVSGPEESMEMQVDI